MEDKEEKRIVPSPSETQLTNAVTAGGSRGKQSSPTDSESFYTKLTELWESSGLSLIFNVRETLLDLYLLYLEVTRRGGYHQVGQEKKWGEVVSALKLEGSNAKLSAQIEKLYAHLLYQFEKLYFYKCPAKQAAAGSTKGPLKRKRNSTTSLSPLVDNEDDQMVTKISEDCFSQMTGDGCVVEQQPVLLPTSSNDKENKKRRGAPRGRNAYHIFLKQECARLKTCGQDFDRPRILRLAVDAWRKMSEIEKQPYVEESKKNKEKIKEAMITHNKQQSMQSDRRREEKRTNACGDYCVTSQPEAYDSLVNKAAVDIALKMTEKASNDPLFLVDWDAYCSLDLASGESK